MVLSELQKKVFEYSKARDSLRLSVLRFLISDLRNREIELRQESKDLTVDEAVKITQKQMKKRRETIDICEKSGRMDLKEKEQAELQVLEEILQFISSLSN